MCQNPGLGWPWIFHMRAEPRKALPSKLRLFDWNSCVQSAVDPDDPLMMKGGEFLVHSLKKVSAVFSDNPSEVWTHQTIPFFWAVFLFIFFSFLFKKPPFRLVFFRLAKRFSLDERFGRFGRFASPVRLKARRHLAEVLKTLRVSLALLPGVCLGGDGWWQILFFDVFLFFLAQKNARFFFLKWEADFFFFAEFLGVFFVFGSKSFNSILNWVVAANFNFCLQSVFVWI